MALIMAWKWPHGKAQRKTLAPLPDGWEMITTKTRRIYYNKTGNVASRSKPFKVELVDGKPAPPKGALLLEPKKKKARIDKSKKIKIVL